MRSPKFLADSMLGKLARWLRLLGFDTFYSPSISDEEMLRIAKNEGRVLLTRDHQLARRAEREGIRVILLEKEDLKGMLVRVASELGFEPRFDPDNTRCPLCNERLSRVKSPSMVRTTWSPPVRAREYWVCPRCGQVYWRGKHFISISRTLEEIRRLLKLKAGGA